MSSRAHFTASALVVDEAGARVCLVAHAKLGRLLQPGGHVEPTDIALVVAGDQLVAAGGEVGVGHTGESDRQHHSARAAGTRARASGRSLASVMPSNLCNHGPSNPW